MISSSNDPLVIAIDNFDCIFEYPAIEGDFCSLLRCWFESVNTNKIWGKLRQIIVYSQEPYGPRDINQSPLNVGYPVELGELDAIEILTLANSNGLSWTEQETKKLMKMIGGHPYLVQTAISEILHQNKTLDQVLTMSVTEEGIYGDYLREHLQRLEEKPLLLEAMQKVVKIDKPVRLGSKETYKLNSMGLIRRTGNDCVPRCNLYRLYFQDRLRLIS